MTSIADDYTHIKRRMRQLGCSCPFDKPEYAEEAKAREETAARERLLQDWKRFYWGGYSIPMP